MPERPVILGHGPAGEGPAGAASGGPAPAATPPDAAPAGRRRRGRWLTVKRWLPASLYGRALLIIILPIALMQIAVTWVFFDAHWQTVTGRLSQGLAGDIAWVVEAYEEDPTALPALAARADRTLGLSVDLKPGRTLPTTERSSFLRVRALDRTLRGALEERLSDPFWFDTTRYAGHVDIRVRVPEGVLQFYAARERASATRAHIFVLWMAGATILLTAVAILFIKNQVRAIERLAAAAEAFGKGADARLKPHGAREVRQAARAFLDMRERIARHIDQRTALLASVSHDLRTPLTRLKLELALARPSKKLEAMKRDVLEMEHMIDEYLAFARGEGGEEVETVGLRGLLDEVGEGARRAGAQVTIHADAALTCAVRPNALKRALANLVMNAAVHGERVEVAAVPRAAGGVEVTVDDDGPGIAPDRYEDAFKPFSRLDESRNQNAKGVGLGLAIARDVARATAATSGSSAARWGDFARSCACRPEPAASRWNVAAKPAVTAVSAGAAARPSEEDLDAPPFAEARSRRRLRLPGRFRLRQAAHGRRRRRGAGRADGRSRQRRDPRHPEPGGHPGHDAAGRAPAAHPDPAGGAQQSDRGRRRAQGAAGPGAADGSASRRHGSGHPDSGRRRPASRPRLHARRRHRPLARGRLFPRRGLGDRRPQCL
jgi:two-component system osmolarity sensor histidine kinase EnvZ